MPDAHQSATVAAVPGPPPDHRVGGVGQATRRWSWPGIEVSRGYTHRVAISNRRLVALEDGRVTFRWKDYAHGNRHRLMSLDAVEFIRRCLLHILPSGFQRLRQYGLLANRGPPDEAQAVPRTASAAEKRRTASAS